jgi:hypothetical protein
MTKPSKSTKKDAVDTPKAEVPQAGPTQPQGRFARRLTNAGNAAVGTVLLLVILVSINWFARTTQARLDLTASKQYTVSKATVRVLQSLQDLVTVNVYATRRDTPPDWTRQREELIAMLSEYRRLSRGRLNFTVKDPSADPEVQREAMNAGIQEQVMQDIGVQEIRARAGFLGFNVQYRGKTETIPALSPTSPIEYQLTRAINKIASVNSPVVGVIVPQGNPFMGEPSMYSIIGQALEQEGFIVRSLQPNKLDELNKPDTEIKMLFVVDPEDMSEEALFRIDQFIMNGGKMFVAAQGVRLEGGSGRVPRAISRAPNIVSLLEYYGLKVNQDIVEDWGRGTEQQFLTPRGIIATINPFIMRVSDLGPSSVDVESVDSLSTRTARNRRPQITADTGSPITNQLPPLAFLFTSSISMSDLGTSGVVEVLARSSSRSRTQEGFFSLDQQRVRPPATKEDLAKLGKRNLVVSVRATENGRLRSRYAVVDPPDLTNDDGTTRAVTASEVRTESAPTAQVIVASATLPFMDNIMQQAPQNLLMLLNMADVLLRDGSTVELRNKQQIYAQLRPDISEREITIAHILVIGGVPVALVVLGLLRALFGRMQRSRHQRLYGEPPAAAAGPAVQ